MSQLSLFDAVEPPAETITQKIESQPIHSLARRSLTRIEAKQRIAQSDELFNRRCTADGLRQCRGCNGFAKLSKQLCSECQVPA